MKSLQVTCKTFVLGGVKGNDEACIVQPNSTKAKNLLYFKKRLRFSCSFFREIVRKLCYLQAKTVLQMGGELWTWKYILRVTFDFIHVSTASVGKFSKKMLCIFKFYYSFKLQTSYHIYFKFPSMGSPLWTSLPCDNPVCRIWQTSTRSCARRFNITHAPHAMWFVVPVQWRVQGRGPAPPLIFRPNWGSKVPKNKRPKNVFLKTDLSPTPTPPPPIISMSGSTV